MNLIPEWVPNIHPMLVHFPIAILSIAIFFDFISFFISKPKKWWSEEATAFLYGVGAVAAVIVYFTGKAAADSVSLPAEAQTVLTHHADWAVYTVWFYGLYSIARIAVTSSIKEQLQLKSHIAFFLISLVGMYFLYETGEHGAEMVFGHGVGVQNAQMENPMEHNHETDHGESASLTTDENGNWTWTISENAADVLGDHFTFLQGSLEAINPSVIEGEMGHSLELHPSNSFFITEQSYGDIQLDLNLSAANFEGSIMITHHVRDVENYDYMMVQSDGSAELGRVENGQKSVIEEGETHLENTESLRLVRAGDHIRGYMNNELILHGHTEAAPEGAIGLKLDGSGSISISQFKLTQLSGEEEHHEHGEEEEHHEH